MPKAPAKKIERPADEVAELELDEVVENDADEEDAPEGGSLTANQIAEMLGVDGRKLRKFIRESAHYTAVGQGKRYAFAEDEVPLMRKRFESATKKARKAAAEKAAQKAKREPIADEPDDLDDAIAEIELEDLDEV